MPGAGKKSEGGVGAFLFEHVEKIALGVTGVVVLVFIFLGSRHAPIQESLEPEKLEIKRRQAIDYIHSSSFGAVRDQRYPPRRPFVERAREDVAEMRLQDYQFRQPWEQTYEPQLDKRQDPLLLAVQELEARPGVAALATTAATGGGLGMFEGGRPPATEDKETETDLPPQPDLRPDQLAEIARYYRPEGGANAVSAHFVAVTGLVPIREQRTLYEQVFKDAAGYDIGRDQPYYFWFVIERAEADSDDWKAVSDTRTARAETKNWAGLPMVMVDQRYVDDALTMPAPPLLMTDLRQYATHSKVPLIQEEEAPGEVEAEVEATEAEPAPGDPFGPGGGRPRPAGDEEDEGVGETEEVEEDVDYRLFRYFDLSVAPGKSYRYRVKLYLHDPNDPQKIQEEESKSDSSEDAERSLRFPTPTEADLHPDVIKRLEARRKREKETGRDIYYRQTDFSNPSPAVGFQEKAGDILASSVTGPKMTRLPGSPTLIQTEEPMATLLAVIWDQPKAMHVSGGTSELLRGTVIQFQKSVWALNPVSQMLEPYERYTFETDATLLDLRGGVELDKLDRKNDKAVTTIGEALVLMPDGSLAVRGEAEYTDKFRRYHFGPLVVIEEEKGTTGGSSGSSGDKEGDLDPGSYLEGAARRSRNP